MSKDEQSDDYPGKGPAEVATQTWLAYHSAVVRIKDDIWKDHGRETSADLTNSHHARAHLTHSSP